MNIQPILHIAEICHRHGIKKAVISPGSRSAPITLGFAHHKDIECRLVNDERSAAFIAMGMALQSQEPVALVCTSGTAALNYAPAIAEAYYQQIPLIVLTADRPPELIDQQDGQCLRQHEIYRNYIKHSFQTPDTLDTKEKELELYNTIQSAIYTSIEGPQGPTHVNVPVREPFYPVEKITIDTAALPTTKAPTHTTEALDFSVLINKILSTQKVLFIAGQQRPNTALTAIIEKLSETYHFPVISDINSNLTSVSSAIQFEDYLFRNTPKDIHPELVITFGNSILSKSLKQYFRNHSVAHWHIAETQPTPDFFTQRTGSYSCLPLNFFEQAIDVISTGNVSYFEHWQKYNKEISQRVATVLNASEFSEPQALYRILKKLPDPCVLHLANSMAVRWVNMIGLESDKKLKVQSNRGVSGIDGCTSTALGYALHSKESNFLITGDIAFFYDRNAYWNDFVPQNLKVILLNNHSGGIFNLIDGPSNLPEHLPFFTSSQRLDASSLCQEFGLNYYAAQNETELAQFLDDFIQSDSSAVLELKTNNTDNKNLFQQLKAISI